MSIVPHRQSIVKSYCSADTKTDYNDDNNTVFKYIITISNNKDQNVFICKDIKIAILFPLKPFNSVLT